MSVTPSPSNLMARGASRGASVEATGPSGVPTSKRPEQSVAHDQSEAPSARMLDIGADRASRSRLKRALDVFGALFGLVILSPLLMAIAVVVALETPGPPVFRQHRTGHRGRTFVIYKFRTMRVQEDGADIQQAQPSDQRITRFGTLLRRTSFDELPQLFNVLRGEMSLVGPRPHAVAHDEYYAARLCDYNNRFKIKPGLTGLAQVSGFRGRTIDDAAMSARIDKDLEYIRAWSLWGDVKILFRTVLIFAFHPAAY